MTKNNRSRRPGPAWELARWVLADGHRTRRFARLVRNGVVVPATIACLLAPAVSGPPPTPSTDPVAAVAGTCTQEL